MASKAKKPVTRALSSLDEMRGTLKRIGGSQNDDFNRTTILQALDSLWTAHSGKEEHEKLVDAAVAAMMGVQPRDEMEGMVAAQMVATHSAAMECFRRAMIKQQTFEGRRESLNQANKLVRSYAMLMEALDRHRGKGQQRVTVEHVHVHRGGQAIVGAVHPGGGASTRSGEQPHAPAITHEPGAPMRGPDPERKAVPIARGAGTAPLQDARRRSGERRADRQPERPAARPLHRGSHRRAAGDPRPAAPDPRDGGSPVSAPAAGAPDAKVAG